MNPGFDQTLSDEMSGLELASDREEGGIGVRGFAVLAFFCLGFSKF